MNLRTQEDILIFTGYLSIKFPGILET